MAHVPKGKEYKRKIWEETSTYLRISKEQSREQWLTWSLCADADWSRTLSWKAKGKTDFALLHKEPTEDANLRVRISMLQRFY